MRFSSYKTINFSIFSIIFVLLSILLTTVIANAATFTVTREDDRNITCNSGVDCSLREAVNSANSSPTDDVINFSGLSKITLTKEIEITSNGTLTINGNGADVLAIDGGVGTNRIFQTNGATVTVRGVKLTGGNGEGAAFNCSVGTLILDEVVVENNLGDNASGSVFFGGGNNHRISNSTFSNNTGFEGCAAFYSLGARIVVTNTTVSGNSTLASGYGTGAICFADGSGTFRNTTIFGNTGGGRIAGGGGIYIDRSIVDLGNTIVAGNTAGPGPDLYKTNSYAAFTTSGGNLIGDNSGNPDNPNIDTFPAGSLNIYGDKVGTKGSVIDSMLGILQNNGGTTPTHALLNGSPAINAGNNSNSTTTVDQRGFARIIGGTVDIGAYEFAPVKSRKRIRFF